MSLTWTAPGLHDNGGAAVLYDVRRSADPPEESTWDEATQVVPVPSPGAPGTRETVTAHDLPEQKWFFALRSSNEVGDWSAVSNVVSTTLDATGPEPVDDLAVAGRAEHSIVLTWTAPQDAGQVSDVVSYDIRLSTEPITIDTWPSATAVVDAPTPGEPGMEQSLVVGELDAGATYYFALTSADELSNASPLSNVASAMTPAEPTVFRLTNSARPFGAGWPKWSPDGSHLVLVADWAEMGHEQVYLLSADGSEVEQVTDLPGRSAGPAFAPDGERVAFYYRASTDDPYGVWIKELTSNTEPMELVQLIGAPFHEVAWSPDGERIAYTDKLAGSRQIFLVDPATGSSTWLAGGSGSEASSPAWSPDGSKIAYVGFDSNGYHIWTMNADGTESVQLTTSGDNSNPCWSPDGMHIVYSAYDTVGQLWTIPATGGAPVQVTTSNEFAFAPAWSPDGNWIAYTVTRNDIKDVWIRSYE
ncbi:MAG: PD40 domain-containing protein [Candidatus Eisenbacteria bacterium]|nr:PD40 domain-containing protein [Candidatus Eisenbacteria bacterium]